MAEQSARRFRRVGVVSAHRLDDSVTWRTASGDMLCGNAGDWWVEGPAGVVRSVTHLEFTATYEPLGEGRYQRSGFTTARQVDVEEVVDTLEGPARALPGDWVVTGPNGNSWPVPDQVFRHSYKEV
ncbi:MAG: hypothetical protein WCF36_21035 [Candidatus Nanopelagicales bacterium]